MHTWSFSGSRARTSLLLTITAAVLLSLIVATLALGSADAQEGATAHPRSEIHAPSPMPDRIVLTPTADPATSQAVSWRTDESVSTPEAQVAVSTQNSGFTSDARTFEAVQTETIQTDLGFASRFHQVEFDGLEPGTQHLYRVGDGVNWSEWFEFTTASDEPEPFSFLYYGDAQNNIQQHWSRVIRRAFVEGGHDAPLMIHAGDLVNQRADGGQAELDHEWGEWFNAASFTGGMRNHIVSPGNHEYINGELSSYWRTQYRVPDNGPQLEGEQFADFDGTVWFTDYQGVRFISLNSNDQSVERMEAQAEWLDQVLADNPNEWAVASFHHPVFSPSDNRDNPRLRDAWLPIFEKHDIDLVLTGHDHSYTRGHVESRLPQGRHDGPVYLVSVSGPSLGRGTLGPASHTDNGAVAFRQDDTKQLYQIVDVEPGRIRFRAYDATGELHDAFTIRKSDSGRKVVSEEPVPGS